jgi:hypothetical protein
MPGHRRELCAGPEVHIRGAVARNNERAIGREGTHAIHRVKVGEHLQELDPVLIETNQVRVVVRDAKGRIQLRIDRAYARAG